MKLTETQLKKIDGILYDLVITAEDCTASYNVAEFTARIKDTVETEETPNHKFLIDREGDAWVIQRNGKYCLWSTCSTTYKEYVEEAPGENREYIEESYGPVTEA